MMPDVETFMHIRQLIEDYEPRRKVFRTLRSLYDQDYVLPFPESVTPTIVKTGKAPEIVDRVSGMLAGEPVYNVFPDGLGQNAKARATKIERFLNAFIRQ